VGCIWHGEVTSVATLSVAGRKHHPSSVKAMCEVLLLCGAIERLQESCHDQWHQHALLFNHAATRDAHCEYPETLELTMQQLNAHEILEMYKPLACTASISSTPSP